MSFFQQGIQAGDFVAHCRDAFTVSGLNDFTLAEVAHISERAFLRHQAIFEDVERLTVLQCDDLELAASIAKAGASAARERTKMLSLRIMGDLLQEQIKLFD